MFAVSSVPRSSVMSPLRNPLPWQGPQWERISRALTGDAVPHALLLAGPAGLGKLLFSNLLGRALMCDDRGGTGTPCGQCRQCALMEAGTHPDSYRLAAEAEKSNILVGQVRQLGHFVALTRNQGRYKVAVIEAADRMNAAAANSLLKTLEEPPDRTVMMLVSDRPGGLPATVRSRCQRIDFRIPPRELTETWLGTGSSTGEEDIALAMARGAPLAVRALLENEAPGRARMVLDGIEGMLSGTKSPVAVARETGETEVSVLLDWMLGWLTDGARSLSKGAAHPVGERAGLPNPGRVQDFCLESVMGLYNQFVEMKRGLHSGQNQELLREDIMLAWLSAASGNPGGVNG